MSQEFNSDPEGWELTDKFGDRAWRTWVEILSILDRNKNSWKLVDGWQTVISRKVRQSPATVSRIVGWMLAKGWLEVGQVSANGQPEILRARNFRKYRKLAGEAEPPPNPPNPPNLTLPKKEEDNTSHLKTNEQTWPSPYLLIEKYNSSVCDDLSAVEKITPARLKKAREYLKLFPEESFWTEVFQEINKSWFLRGLSNGTGHQSFKANFDWLLTKGKDGTENAAKVFEGRYRNGS